MEQFLGLLTDVDSPQGKAVVTIAIAVVALLVAQTASWVVHHRVQDPTSRYYARKLVRAIVLVVALIAIAIVWRAFAGRAGVVLGLLTAGVAFAMQEVIGALAGGANILFGSIFSVGDRIEMGGVRGDVIDVTPLRTKVMEIGSATDERAWVKGHQYTGRIVTISNKATFTGPVFNYSAGFEYLWDEVAVGIGYDADIETAERILLEEAQRVSGTKDAEAAITAMARRYPVPRADVEPRVFVRTTDSWVELSARFVVPIRTARLHKDQFTRRVLSRLAEAGIAVSYPTVDTIIQLPDGSNPGVPSNGSKGNAAAERSRGGLRLRSLTRYWR